MPDSTSEIFTISPPAIPTGNAYYFTTGKGVQYEVRFGRKQDNFLNATIVFGVLNEEYEGEEYVVTNSGELYRVMATIVKIIRTYMEYHPNINSFEFTGEPNKEINTGEPSTRTKLYARYLDKIFDKNWTVEEHGNKTVIIKERNK